MVAEAGEENPPEPVKGAFLPSLRPLCFFAFKIIGHALASLARLEHRRRTRVLGSIPARGTYKKKKRLLVIKPLLPLPSARQMFRSGERLEARYDLGF